MVLDRFWTVIDGFDLAWLPKSGEGMISCVDHCAFVSSEILGVCNCNAVAFQTSPSFNFPERAIISGTLDREELLSKDWMRATC